MKVTEGDTRADSHLAGDIVDGIEAGQSPGGKDDRQRVALGCRHAPGDEPGVPPLRDDRDTSLRAGNNDRCHFGRAARPDDGERRASPATTPVGGVGGHDGPISHHVLVTNLAYQLIEEGHARHGIILPQWGMSRNPDTQRAFPSRLCEYRGAARRGRQTPAGV